MSETNLFSSQTMATSDEIVVRTWRKGQQSVYGQINMSVRFDLEHVMDVIEDNWASFDKSVRKEFARQISALDQIDAMNEVKKDVEEKDKEFEWR